MTRHDCRQQEAAPNTTPAPVLEPAASAHGGRPMTLRERMDAEGVASGEGLPVAWTDEEFAKPYGAEVGFMRRLSGAWWMPVELRSLLRHCAKLLEGRAAVDAENRALKEAARPEWVIRALNNADELLESLGYTHTDLRAARDYIEARRLTTTGQAGETK